MSRLLLSALLLLAAFATSEGAVAQQQAKVGERVVIAFGAGNLVVKRTTSANPKPQYIFALGEGMDGWTTDGGDRINASKARLFFNGTLVIEKASKADFGSYEIPMEEPAPGLPKSLYELSEKN
ncbi:hypothetical protein QR680_009426 [Steinernema hermaphroditum]|uniref:Uncharacterized protein n=1 Tax=Steinernema hermaphroditum TaxID=289476 RepID=A0AA39ILZ6_9BILA|nr:hypothetical protein QR680_009426 [Steinernema hermaphroditum]